MLRAGYLVDAMPVTVAEAAVRRLTSLLPVLDIRLSGRDGWTTGEPWPDGIDGVLVDTCNTPPSLPDVVDWFRLPDPAGGAVVESPLLLAFRHGDARFMRLRSLFVRSVVFAGAGCGRAGTCTVETVRALQRCEVCLHDSLIDPAVLDYLPAGAERVDVGKRRDYHRTSQPAITAAIVRHALEGRRVVRLKGGDPGIFGRLAEELEELDALRLPYRVLPGVSALSMATTGTGLLLTRRGVSRGFTAMTPRLQSGGLGAVTAAERAAQPLVLFMAVGVVREMADQLMAEGQPPKTPAALVLKAGRDGETVLRGTLYDIAGRTESQLAGRMEGGHVPPGVLIVGDIARHGYETAWGALAGERIRIRGDRSTRDALTDAIHDFGGVPVFAETDGLDLPPGEPKAAVAQLARECVNRLLQRQDFGYPAERSD